MVPLGRKVVWEEGGDGDGERDGSGDGYRLGDRASETRRDREGVGRWGGRGGDWIVGPELENKPERDTL